MLIITMVAAVICVSALYIVHNACLANPYSEQYELVH